jgi:hypothetical protein
LEFLHTSNRSTEVHAGQAEHGNAFELVYERRKRTVVDIRDGKANISRTTFSVFQQVGSIFRSLKYHDGEKVPLLMGGVLWRVVQM